MPAVTRKPSDDRVIAPAVAAGADYTRHRRRYTGPRFVQVLTAAGARVSMDGRGRRMDTTAIGRLRWSVRYGRGYPHAFATGSEVRAGRGAGRGSCTMTSTGRMHPAPGSPAPEPRPDEAHAGMSDGIGWAT